MAEQERDYLRGVVARKRSLRMVVAQLERGEDHFSGHARLSRQQLLLLLAQRLGEAVAHLGAELSGDGTMESSAARQSLVAIAATAVAALEHGHQVRGELEAGEERGQVEQLLRCTCQAGGAVNANCARHGAVQGWLQRALLEPSEQEWHEVEKAACGSEPVPSSVRRAVRRMLALRRQEFLEGVHHG
jgi:hypothetical protein